MDKNRRSAIQLILLFGVVSFFGDIVYEGARSVNGPYLKTLGANAAVVGFIAGLGEFVGYAIRLLSGYFADRTKAHWVITFIGYGMLITVPLLSLAGVWQSVALLIVLERIGKAIRSPAKDTIVSQASKQIGTGFGFGLQEAMDRLGATVGPLIFTFLFMALGRGDKSIADYQKGYALLWVPFILLMVCVLIAYLRVPEPQKLEEAIKKAPEPDKLTSVFWLYTIFSFIATAGFVNFALLGYHFKARQIMPDAQIPLFYAVAMAIAGVVALLIGRIYDRFKAKHKDDNAGLLTLIVIPLASLFIPVLGFSTNYNYVLASMVLWGIVFGAHMTIMKSAIADLTPLKKRGTGYGIFNTSYGLAIFIGSVFMGLLYERSIGLLVVASVIIELISIPIFFIMVRNNSGGVK